jgi:hypothetical protein
MSNIGSWKADRYTTVGDAMRADLDAIVAQAPEIAAHFGELDRDEAQERADRVQANEWLGRLPDYFGGGY